MAKVYMSLDNERTITIHVVVLFSPFNPHKARRNPADSDKTDGKSVSSRMSITTVIVSY